MNRDEKIAAAKAKGEALRKKMAIRDRRAAKREFEKNLRSRES